MNSPGERTNNAYLYRRLLEGKETAELKLQASALLNQYIEQQAFDQCDLPENPQDLDAWMQHGATSTTHEYAEYLSQRKDGAARKYFINRAHALYFLKSVAPTKLVDGAWLYGLLEHWRNPKFAGLIRTYIEELGGGVAGKNHVAIYKSLLAGHDLNLGGDIDDRFYTQGVIQLALATNAADFLPEVIGFNLGYEQLPLHLLITGYELNELNIDPYYFTLHTTIDNSDTGHARHAVHAVLDNLPQWSCANEFWRRVQTGYKLSNAGAGTKDAVGSFDIDAEVVRIFRQKSTVGHNAHSDYCSVSGRKINDWLSSEANIPEFLRALQKSRWIILGEPVHKSRFWNLLEGDRAEMSGVFSAYELQVIHDWIRGEGSSDGLPYSQANQTESLLTPPTFRNASRLDSARGVRHWNIGLHAQPRQLLDPDLQMLIEKVLHSDPAGREATLIKAMAPAQHWTAAGLYATRLFNELIR